MRALLTTAVALLALIAIAVFAGLLDALALPEWIEWGLLLAVGGIAAVVALLAADAQPPRGTEHRGTDSPPQRQGSRAGSDRDSAGTGQSTIA